MLAGVAHGGNGVGILAMDEQHTMLRKGVEIDAAAFVLLDDFKTVATTGTATKLRRGSEGGMREDKNGSRGRLHFTCAVEQAARIISEDDLLNAGKR